MQERMASKTLKSESFWMIRVHSGRNFQGLSTDTNFFAVVPSSSSVPKRSTSFLGIAQFGKLCYSLSAKRAIECVWELENPGVWEAGGSAARLSASI